jgi:hypothetical protein
LQENAELCPEVDLQLRTERTDIGENNLFDLAIELTERHIRSFALLLSLLLLASPILCIKYIDDIYRISRSSKSSSYVQNQDSENIDEEVPFSKRLAYRLDVLFSNHSFIKPLALFMATVLLIAVGGMALFGVGGENLADALWRAWTYIADSGNHADSTGIGPRLVSVFISFGGMLIFALMLGLVSDAISEKVDSLRKGKSEVIEHDHTLILGWSDKLVSPWSQLALCFSFSTFVYDLSDPFSCSQYICSNISSSEKVDDNMSTCCGILTLMLFIRELTVDRFVQLCRGHS